MNSNLAELHALVQKWRKITWATEVCADELAAALRKIEQDTERQGVTDVILKARRYIARACSVLACAENNNLEEVKLLSQLDAALATLQPQDKTK